MHRMQKGQAGNSLTSSPLQLIISEIKTLTETVAPEDSPREAGMVGSRCRIPEAKITPEFRTKTPAETVQEVGFDGYPR